MLQAMWQSVRRALQAVDHGLVCLASPFGVNVTDPYKRYAVMLGVYGAIYLLALLPVPVLPLVALGIGYVGVLAVGRAWVLNENQRNAIAKGLADGKPDEMPDLRGAALVSALQLLILFPLLFHHTQSQFALYRTPPDTTFLTWVLFTVESYNKAFLSLPEVYGIHLSPHIEYDSSLGRHLVTLSRLTFDFLLIQAVVRLIAIRSTIREAVELTIRQTREQVREIEGSGGTCIVSSVVTLMDIQGKNPIRRIGRRSVGLLIEHLQNNDPVVRSMAAAHLGRLGDRSAVPYLVKLLADPTEAVVEGAVNAVAPLLTKDDVERQVVSLVRDELARVRHAALEILSRAKDPRAVEPLLVDLANENVEVRRRVAKALTCYRDGRVVEPLINALGDPDAEVRGYAANGLGFQQDARAIEPLIQSLQRETIVYPAVEIVKALSRLQATAAVERLIQLLSDLDDKSVRIEIIGALGQLKDRRALSILLKWLRKKNPDYRVAAVRALGELGDFEAYDALLSALQDDSTGDLTDSVRAVAVEALGNLKDPRAVDALIPLLQDEEAEMRASAAVALGKLGESRAVQPLSDLLQRESDPYVRGKATDAIKLLDPAPGNASTPRGEPTA